MEQEIWKRIPGYEGFYEASNLGRVRNGLTGVIRKPWVDPLGYCRIPLVNKGGKRFTNKVHRMVAFSFIDNPNNYPEVNHINGIKTDNRACNLEWCDRKMNIRHAYATGLNKVLKGDQKKIIKISESQVLEIFKSNENAKILSKKYGVTRTLIWHIKSGRIRSYVTGVTFKPSYRHAKDKISSIYTSPMRPNECAKKHGITGKQIANIRNGSKHKKITENLKRMVPVIIVPYRDREDHKKKFLYEIKKFIPSSKVVIVEQDDDRPFNRGKLINSGFLIFENEGDYFIFHDIDMIPVSGMVDYDYPKDPTHIATQCSQFNYTMQYSEYFGGVNIFTSEQFRSVNGFVNTMIGWGGEDDLLYQSFMIKEISISRRLCRFESLPHERHIDPILHRRNVQKLSRPRDFNDGLTSCIFTITSREEKEGYTHIKVKI